MWIWLSCKTQDEIAEAVGVPRDTINGWINSFVEITQQAITEEIETLVNLREGAQSYQTANFQDDFKQPIYNLWSFGLTTNKTEHFGQTEQRLIIVQFSTIKAYYQVLNL